MSQLNLTMEVPYNFDPEVLSEYVKPKYNSLIDTVFMAPYTSDSCGAKKFHAPQSRRMQSILHTPSTRESYEEHLQLALATGRNITILLQDLKSAVDIHILEYYLNKGVRNFIVTRNDTAAMLKHLDPSVRIISSITRKMSWAEYHDGVNTENFDEFVLYFPFNRNLSRLAELHKNLSYVMLTNCTCGFECPGHLHWYAGMEDFAYGNKQLINPEYISTCRSFDKGASILIQPEHLQLIAPLISKIKLQGREYSTEDLLDSVERYSSGILTPPVLSPREISAASAFYNIAESPYLLPTIPTHRYGNWSIEAGAMEEM